jgi:hypothetical protein
MKMKWNLQILVVLVCGIVGHGYSQGMDDEIIPFDITFWKKELRLKKSQTQQIHLINQSLYNSLRQVSNSTCVEGKEVQMLLQLWNTAVTGTLTSKQKRKWEKLLRINTAPLKD